MRKAKLVVAKLFARRLNYVTCKSTQWQDTGIYIEFDENWLNFTEGTKCQIALRETEWYAEQEGTDFEFADITNGVVRYKNNKGIALQFIMRTDEEMAEYCKRTKSCIQKHENNAKIA